MLILNSFYPNKFYKSWLKSWMFGSPQQLLVVRSCEKSKQTGPRYGGRSSKAMVLLKHQLGEEEERRRKEGETQKRNRSITRER
jgi:hypothetical protein